MFGKLVAHVVSAIPLLHIFEVDANKVDVARRPNLHPSICGVAVRTYRSVAKSNVLDGDVLRRGGGCEAPTEVEVSC